MNLFLILLLLNALFGRRDRLYCGLFGWVGTSVDHFVPLKLKFLGVLNDSRGGDGVGIFNGTELIKSINPDEFGKLIIKDDDSKTFSPKVFPIFLGHTRKRSTGFKDLEHTQPIIQKTENGLSTRIFHNGTITDLQELITTAELTKEIPSVVNLSDTQVLTKILHIYRERGLSFKPILESYTGAASLMMSFSDDPEAVYLFRGRLTYPSGSFATERPLYYVREEGKGYYISSIEESLKYISDNENFGEVLEVPENTLIKIVGDTEEVVELIPRVYKAKPVSSYNRREIDDEYYYYQGAYGGVRTFGNFGTKVLKFSNLFEYKNLNAVIKEKKNSAIEALDYISSAYHKDCLLNRYFTAPSTHDVAGGRVIFYKGRYLVCYAHTGGTIRSALANQSFVLDSKGYIIFPTQKDGKVYKFNQGILLKEDISPSEIAEVDKNESPNMFSMENGHLESMEYFLEYAAEPVCVLNKVLAFIYTLDSTGRIVKFTGEFQPKFTGKIYTINSGEITYMRYESVIPAVPAKTAPVTIVTPSVPAIRKTEVYVTQSNLAVIMERCPACDADSLLCKVCNGMGYIRQEAVSRYNESQKVIPLPLEVDDDFDDDEGMVEYHTGKITPVDCEDDCNSQDLVDEEVIDKIKILSNTISSIENELNIIGDTSPLLEKYKELLETIQDDLTGLVYA